MDMKSPWSLYGLTVSQSHGLTVSQEKAAARGVFEPVLPVRP
jgi:hypothetical protein